MPIPSDIEKRVKNNEFGSLKVKVGSAEDGLKKAKIRVNDV